MFKAFDRGHAVFGSIGPYKLAEGRGFDILKLDLSIMAYIRFPHLARIKLATFSM